MMSNGETVQTKRSAWGGTRLWLQAPFLLALWLVLSGKLDLFHVGSGVFATGLVLWLDRKLGPASLEEGERPLRPHFGRHLLYFPWLAWQMLVASWQVGRVIVHPAMGEKIAPNLIRFRSAQPHVIAKVVLANSITLTPGTLTVKIEGDSFLVHALTAESARSLLEGTMQRKVAAAFGVSLEEPVTDAAIVTGRRAE